MDKTVRVECTDCGKTYHVFDFLIPADVRDDEAFPMECAYCEEGRYAIIVAENTKHQIRRSK